MEKEVQEFIDLLLTPVAPKDADVFVQLCREELIETLEDSAPDPRSSELMVISKADRSRDVAAASTTQWS